MTVIAVKERGIIFSGSMVRAILDGRKTQTRRVIRNPDRFQHIRYSTHCCPFGVRGERLWVRETWRLGEHYHDYTPQEIRETAEFGTNPMEEHVHYRAEESPNNDKWRSPIHMPRWASRINLFIAKVHVEKVQEITEQDAIDEGVFMAERAKYMATYRGITAEAKSIGPLDYFRELWDSLNTKRYSSWESNPWVWVITFHRVMS